MEGNKLLDNLWLSWSDQFSSIKDDDFITLTCGTQVRKYSSKLNKSSSRHMEQKIVELF